MKTQKLPPSFKRLLWSYNFNKLDPIKNKKVIILNTINFGNLLEWKWIKKTYGSSEIKKILNKAKPKELRNGAKKLANLILVSKQ